MSQSSNGLARPARAEETVTEPRRILKVRSVTIAMLSYMAPIGLGDNPPTVSLRAEGEHNVRDDSRSDRVDLVPACLEGWPLQRQVMVEHPLAHRSWALSGIWSLPGSPGAGVAVEGLADDLGAGAGAELGKYVRHVGLHRVTR
jgi:hypothetical protein